MIAPVMHEYPPAGYGPWERVTHDLTERLVETGHDVTLFGAASSKTAANLVPTIAEPLIAIDPSRHADAEAAHIAAAVDGCRGDRFDVVHSHLHVHVLRHARELSRPLVSTLHGSAWDRHHHDVLREHRRRPFVSISDKERDFLPDLNYVATIHNGIRIEDFPAGDGGSYLAFVGRLAPEKAPHLAIEVSRRTGWPLVLAGPVDNAHQEYGEKVLRSAGPGVDFVGPLDRDDLSSMLRGAAGLLMPLQWDEPFGLVVVESLASGTPVVAWRRGAMPEIIEEGVTGFLVDDVAGAVEAVAKLSTIARADCTAAAFKKFSDTAMADAYAGVYAGLSDHGVE